MKQVAGHETTSATLSFTYFNLLKHPEKLHKAQLQVDEVVGNGVLKLEHLAKLDYIDACIKETLRMSAPIAAWSVSPKEDTLLDGKYKVTNDMNIQVNVKGLHRDRTVWGDDVEVFRPERFLNGGFQALPPNSWKPFGSGMRACIGRTFAEQEMIMNIALVLQRFQIELADPAYALQLKSTLTIKPDHFRMKVRRRPGKTLMTGIPGGIPFEIAKNHEKKSQDMHEQGPKGDNLSPILIFFGGSTGTCEGFAQDIESKASSYGLHATIKSLNLATEDIPKDQPVIFITASYEGKPPDNAKKFITWLEQLENPSHLKGVNYTVFGVGNSDWASTFHRIPKLVDETMTKLGATRFLEAGYTNVKTDLVGPWEDWSEKLFEALTKTTGATKTEESKLSITIQSSESAQRIGGPEMKLGAILVNRELADSSIGPAKRHMEIRLPEGSQYTPGDYLVVTPHNPPETVHRILARFGLVPDDVLTFSGSKKKFLPAVPVAVGNFLFTTVELNTPITRRQVGILASHATGELKSKLDRLQEEEPYATLLAKRYSVIDLLEELMLDIPFEVYIDMLQSLLPRQYSISSSPLHPSSNPSGSEHADVCSLTYDILSGPSFSSPDRVYNGVCSTYLATRRPGDLIPCFVRSTNIGFRLPTNPETPVIMIAAGTGLAPMRAFLQERAAIASAGINKLGPAILFFGCRYEDKDYIYRDELLSFQKDGIVEVETAFSRQSGKLGKGTYVQDVLWEHREKVAEMFRARGKIFLCGSATKLGKSVSETCKKIYIERLGCSEQEAEEWLERVKEDRFVSDVFG
jgi:cytochrome P450/NADPH-cytochrome P450 reductase